MSKKKASSNEKKDDRCRNWNFILYPESAPANWRDIIDELHIEWIESPLHDRDVDPSGELKKEHYHNTLLYPGPQSFEQVRELTDRLNAPIPIKCKSAKGSVRYMVHKDNPDKFQYNWADIKCHGGADLDAICAPTHSERTEILVDMVDYIEANRVVEFQKFAVYCKDNNREWFNVLMNFSTLSLDRCIASNRHLLEKEEYKNERVKGLAGLPPQSLKDVHDTYEHGLELAADRSKQERSKKPVKKKGS